VSVAKGLNPERVAATQEIYLRKTILVRTIMAAAAAAAVAAPLAAVAQPKHRYLVCNTQSAVRRNANNGTIIGGVGGALVGQAIGHNTAGTLIGAGAGAVAGHEIAKSRAKRNCHYVYR
jgi:uncharacterized protein YcfJ